MKQTILSGIQPSGKLHIGNYLGALRNFVELQHTHRCFFFIADYHSITENYDPKTKQAEIIELATDYLAAGLDPKKSTLFIQSYVPEHFELAWIFNSGVPMSELERMTQYKDKASRQVQNINVGLFTYPVLQAVDILMYQPDAIPVGEDQDQHIELARVIARKFNNNFGKTFKEPRPLHTKTPRVMSILEPERKMSKSLGDAHCIYISDEPEVIKKKLSRAVSDGGDGKSAGGQNLLRLCEEFCSPADTKRFKASATKSELRYGELKEALGNGIADYFADFRKRKTELSKKPDKVLKTFQAGSKKAEKIADAVMKDVRKKIGIR